MMTVMVSMMNAVVSMMNVDDQYDECHGQYDECRGQYDECHGQCDECSGQYDECGWSRRRKSVDGHLLLAMRWLVLYGHPARCWRCDGPCMVTLPAAGDAMVHVVWSPCPLLAM